ncbi:MAG: Re/Si-specific NAD(P)(+) transhydrogenase subunit alpha [Calditrichaeota bacterium]|nr:MAG: Re/Si-specific NAD(P)(+) transhydrogenase subunit alpha [Calditrichota bacterium]
MIVGIPKETFPNETRVALIPAHIPALSKAGIEVIVESGAGTAAGFLDQEYEEKGAKLVKDRSEVFSKADVILQVRALGANPDKGLDDLKLMKEGQVIIGFLEPLTAKKEVEELAKKKVTAFAMELIPRITRAQSMDALSSMANLAGYKAVILAADHLPKIFPMMMTAAGTIVAAKVFIVGAGVAGLQAIATARRLGAVVQAYDIRPAVKEQVMSLGAKFVELELTTEEAEDKGGYAKAMDEEFYRKQREMMTTVVAESDVVITTAAVPGKKAPILVTEEMVKGMKSGSVIVDLAAERGGNCEITEPGKVVQKHGVTIVGALNLPSEVPFNASQTYSKNITNFLALLNKEGQLTLDMEDEIVRDTMVTRDGEIVNPKVKEALGLS